MKVDIYQVIAKLKSLTSVTEIKDGWKVVCPFHDDHNPSMKVWLNGGWYCMGCQKGGSLALLDEMLGGALPNYPSTPSSSRQRSSGKWQELGTQTAEYIYRDESGSPLFKVCRYTPKSFRQMRWTGSGWKWGLRGVRRVLYNLHLIAKYPTAKVVMCEGEKDADLLTKHGILATTTPMGAGKWRAEYGESLRGRTVILIPDNDEVGVLHMTSIVTYLNKNKIADARVVRIPNQYKDVSEWGEVEKIKDLMKGAER
ncbi:MAG TPA: hypothetical protein ENL23_01630 [Candidatus Acetothermia bacterium]|nr:hypothetical protein [Candidatus Acetothermia bacterium]